MLLYEGGRRLYLFAMTENMRYLMRRWQKQLFPEDLKREKGIVERDIWSAATLYELDDAYSRKMADIDNVEEFYRVTSCCNYFDGVSVPMAFVNAADDPIIPPNLVNVIKDAVSKSLHLSLSPLNKLSILSLKTHRLLQKRKKTSSTSSKSMAATSASTKADT